jgi:glucose-1-phosphate thymidylyltransferase
MKGIILAGGTGSRLYPITRAVSKQLLPVGGKPMIYYPLSILMLCGITDIAIISTPHDLPSFKKLFGSGEELGLSFTYIEQPKPEGIAQSFILAEDFIANESVALILGDNIFHGHDMGSLFKNIFQSKEGGLVFGYEVDDPSRYGVVAFDEDYRVVDIIEKPKIAPSKYAVTGLYFYDSNVCSIAKKLRPSPRGELEITDLNVEYLKMGALQVKIFERGFAWLDTGTHEDLHNASLYIDTIQKRQGIQIGCLEEIAYEMGYISTLEFERLAAFQKSSSYGQYLLKLSEKTAKTAQSLQTQV